MRVSYTIIFVSDMARSISFYRDVLGRPLKFESPEWTEFATEGATLALHKSDGSNPDDDPPQPEPAGRCRPGLQVPNLEGFHNRMIEKNVPCIQKPTEPGKVLVRIFLPRIPLRLTHGSVCLLKQMG